jgi:hypothetical protein
VEQSREKRIVTLDQLPDEPSTMPPPYWRGSGAIFHVIDSLDSLANLLDELIPVHQHTELEIEKYYERYPDESVGDSELEEFGEICNDLNELEHRINLKAGLAIFMSAIQTEDNINRFCVYNLHKDIAESIEKLSPSEKLLIASAVVGAENAKGNAAFEAVKKLSSWRNAFAHGHCVDRPTKSLRHNHLISPAEYPGVPDMLAKMKDLVASYIRVSDYLQSISLNPYTAGSSYEIKEIQELLQEISRYGFEGSNQVYTVTFDSSTV